MILFEELSTVKRTEVGLGTLVQAGVDSNNDVVSGTKPRVKEKQVSVLYEGLAKFVDIFIRKP